MIKKLLTEMGHPHRTNINLCNNRKDFVEFVAPKLFDFQTHKASPSLHREKTFQFRIKLLIESASRKPHDYMATIIGL